MLSLTFATYNVGEIVNIDDQNIEVNTCYEGNGYSVNDPWKLANFNGEVNGGDYYVTLLVMEASW